MSRLITPDASSGGQAFVTRWTSVLAAASLIRVGNRRAQYRTPGGGVSSNNGLTTGRGVRDRRLSALGGATATRYGSDRLEDVVDRP